VRIELRKVETLPGGGVVNTFHDFVGPSPVNLWSASEEYGLLRSVSPALPAGWPSNDLGLSKTFHFQFGYPNQYRPVLICRIEVRACIPRLRWF
jgi:hypothetical protein